MFENMIDTFPFDVDNANHKKYDEVFLDIFHIEEENGKKIKEKDDEENAGGFARPEVDYPYEEDLPEKELPFQTSTLQKAGGKMNENYGTLIYNLINNLP